MLTADFTDFGFKKLEKGHREAQLKYSSYIHNENIQAKIQEQYRTENEQATVAVRKMIESIQYLARQGLAIHGLGLESDSGNFMEVLKLRSADVPELENWLKRKTTWISRRTK